MPLWPHMYRKCNACLCHADMWAAHSSLPLCHWVSTCQHAYINRVIIVGSPLQETWLSPTKQLSQGIFLHLHPQPTTLQLLAAATMLSLPPTRPLQQSWWVRQAWQELAPPANTRPRRVSIALETMLFRQEPKRYSTATSKPHLSSATRRCRTATVRKSNTACAHT